MSHKTQDQIILELSKLPKITTKQPKTSKSNMYCSCGNQIKEGDAYYIKIYPGELPEIFCEMCISINI